MKSQELAIDKLKSKISELEEAKSWGTEQAFSDKDALKLENYYSQLSIINDRLEQTKKEARDLTVELTKAGIEKESLLAQNQGNDVFSNKLQVAKNGIINIGNKIWNLERNVVSAGAKITIFGTKMAKAFASKTIGKAISSISNKLGSLKNKISRLIGGVTMISLISGGFNKLKRVISDVLQTDDQFSSNLKQVKANLMTAFAPIYNAVMPALNSLMQILKQVTSAIAQFTSSLFGTNLAGATKQAKKLSSALDDTAKSGEKASGSLASFDKLEVIGNDSSSGGSSSGFDYSQVSNANTELLGILNKIRDLVSTGDWGGLAQLISQGFITGLQWIQDKIKSIPWEEIGSGISDFITNIDYSGIFTNLVSIFGEAVLGLQKMFLKINWGKFFKNFSKGLKDGISKISYYITQIKWGELGQKITDIITNIDWGGIGSSILQLIWDALSGLGTMLLSIDWGSVAETISKAVNEWIETIIHIFTTTNWGEVASKIVDAIFDFIEGVDWLQLGGNILLGICDGIVAFIDFVIGAFKQLIARILNLLGIHSPSTLFADVGKNLMLGFINGIKSMFNSVINVFKNLWNTLVNGAKNAWNGIKNVFSTVASFFGNVFSTAWTKVKNIFSTGGKIFDGIKDGIAKVFTQIVNAIIKGINKVISLPFKGINKVLKGIHDVSVLGVKPFGFVHTVDIPEIPLLATGAVIPPRQKFLAMLGDQKHGTNIEAPLDTIKRANEEVFDEKLGSLQDLLYSLGNSNRDIVIDRLEVPLYCDNREIGRASIKGIRIAEKENGKQYFVE